MAQIGSLLQQALRSSQNARVLGCYNEAIVILDDYISENSEARSSFPVCNELALIYLAQGYLRRAHETLEETSALLRDPRDPEAALFNLLLAFVKLQYYGDMGSMDACEKEYLLVWKGYLEPLALGGHTETHVRDAKSHRRQKLTNLCLRSNLKYSCTRHNNTFYCSDGILQLISMFR